MGVERQRERERVLKKNNGGIYSDEKIYSDSIVAAAAGGENFVIHKRESRVGEYYYLSRRELHSALSYIYI